MYNLVTKSATELLGSCGAKCKAFSLISQPLQSNDKEYFKCIEKDCFKLCPEDDELKNNLINELSNTLKGNKDIGSMTMKELCKNFIIE